MIVLGIESSCDETAVSIVENKNGFLNVLSNIVSSQVKLHAKWGGVVPNLAAREHVKNIPQVLRNALGEAKISPAQIDLISVTNGPGLIPALLVGTGTARTLAYLWEKPLLGVHHIEGHIYANFISNNISTNKNNNHTIKFPALALVVSGGHTQLVFMKDHFKYEIIGQTLDDAVGEAFDKVARILNIGYPGGPAVARYAQNFQFSISNFQTKSKKLISNNQKNLYKIQFPRPIINRKNFDFSFSGLKTAVLYETKKNTNLLKNKQYLEKICNEFQQACVDVLISKTLKAAEKLKPKTIMLAGGVSANKELREQLGKAIEKNLPKVSYNIPDLSLTGDNATMIAAAAALRFEKMNKKEKNKLFLNWNLLKTDPNLKLN